MLRSGKICFIEHCILEVSSNFQRKGNEIIIILISCIIMILALVSYFSKNVVEPTEVDVIGSVGESLGESEAISSEPNGNSDLPDMILHAAITPAPEPATMLLFGLGLAGLAGLTLRRKKN